MHGSAFLKPIQNILNEISKSKAKEFAEILYDRIKSVQANPPPKSEAIYFNQNDVKCVQCARDREIYILVVKFDHKKGSVIEYIIPKEAQHKFVQGTDIEKSIVFSALPDAAHTSENDYSFFMIDHPSGGHYYGVTCFRQLRSNLIKTEESTRAYLQKAVVILSTSPLYNLFYNKLELTTHAYFNQQDFSNIKILEDMYLNIVSIEYINSISDLSCGLPLRALLSNFGKDVFHINRYL